ncbi:DUF4190 domain-containing protein [Marinactinospora thermotolerans]|uniref:DUF4190 domain-containing protein n=1 Tax=Marinactinospora thermotolerans DSM 45154 TaxID=1122192 RepID=A0A1T4QRJ0_9ACTN|nr:hypothetical protein [Marinactinospora thermotolerans]SKA06372.1 hypothetical protein SAMN02745673_02389 [Marinactinospora thermotolerans DSM 45154]
MTNEPSTSPSDGQQPTVERGGLWGLFFATAGLLLPPFGVVLSVFGIVQGRRARKSARANRVPAPGAVLSMVLGWAGVLFSAGTMIGYLVFGEEIAAWQDCSARSHTSVTQAECDTALRDALAERGVPAEYLPALSGAR